MALTGVLGLVGTGDRDGRRTYRKAPAMARTIEFVQTEKASNVKQSVALEDIDPEIVTEIEEMYAQMKKNPAGRFRITFDSKADLLQYISQANAYAELRPAGAIRFRKSPTRKLAENVGDFRVTDIPVTGTDEIRAAIPKGIAAGPNPGEVALTPVKAARGRK